MTAGRSPPGEPKLRGRRNERAALDELLAAARAGRSETLVLRGEAGIGKTALLEHAVESASDFRVLRVAGVESEMELPFAALHQLCAPLHDWLDRLPGPQRDALATTFGLSEGTVPDRFFVGLATLSLLSEAADAQPLLCVIDDAQWLDRASAQALAFVARRLVAESVVMLFAVREPMPELAGAAGAGGRGTGGCRRTTAPRVGRARAPGSAGRRPARGRSPREPARSPGAAARAARRPSSPAGSACRRRCRCRGASRTASRQRLEALPADTRRLLLVAATDPTGDPALARRAAARLGLTDAALESLAGADLIEIGDASPVPPSAGALRGLPRRSPGRTPPRPRGAGGRDRPAGRSGPARLASRRGDGRHRRVRRRRARARRRPRPGARRPGRCRRLPRARRGVDAGPGPACAAGVGGGTGEVRGRGARRRRRAARHRGGRRRR